MQSLAPKRLAVVRKLVMGDDAVYTFLLTLLCNIVASADRRWQMARVAF